MCPACYINGFLFLIFAAGFITASFLTHGYFKNAYESKVNQTLNQPNIPKE